MTEHMGEQWVAWTARVAVGCYVLRLVIDLWLPAGTSRNAYVRAIWTAGCAVFLLHVAAAFEFVHGWSHQAAYEHTARQTAGQTGLDWGGGLYFNYAFAVLWIIDAGRMWLQRDFASARVWNRTVHAVFAFMMINATMVFGPPLWRWLGPVIIAVLLLLVLRSRTRHSQP